MILPCRIHHPRKRVNLPLAVLFAISLLAPVVQGTAQDAAGSSEEAGPTFFPLVPLQITAEVDLGYDDNVNFGGSTGGGSLFARENLVLTYHRNTQRTQVELLGVGRFAQFFDLSTDDKNGNVTLSLTHAASTRLIFYASAYAAYQTEPDFVSNVGLENVRADHFFTNDTLWVAYYWLPRFVTITSYTFQRVKYAQSAGASQVSQADQASQDRMGNTLGEQLLFSLTSRINHHLTKHLIFRVLGGATFRSFKSDGDTIDPSAEGSLTYLSSNHSVQWTTSYGVEEPSSTTAVTRTTIRTGLRLTYDLTSRITSTTGVYYHHDVNEDAGPSGFTPGGSQDALYFSLGLKYTINKHFAVQINYEHTTVGSLGSTPGYSRNSYFGGLTYNY